MGQFAAAANEEVASPAKSVAEASTTTPLKPSNEANGTPAGTPAKPTEQSSLAAKPVDLKEIEPIREDTPLAAREE